MYLSARHRGKGVGQLLLSECLRRAAVLRFRKCYAETISEMKEAIRFYEANGFGTGLRSAAADTDTTTAG